MPQCKELPRQAPGGVLYDFVRSQLGFLFIPEGEVRTMAVEWGGYLDSLNWLYTVVYAQLADQN